MKRSLSRIELGLFLFFLLWMLIGVGVTLAGVTAERIRTLAIPSFLQGFILLCLVHGDPVSIVLAAFNTHLTACRTWGNKPARKWAAIVLATSAGIEAIGTLSGWPFGVYHYTDNFGPRIGGILPIVIPLSWLVLLTNVLFITRYWDYVRPWQEAFLVALGVTFLDWVMEPFAVTIKAYWLWSSPTIPVQNYFSWFLLSLLLVKAAAPPVRFAHSKDVRPPVILGMMFGLFLVARLVSRV